MPGIKQGKYMDTVGNKSAAIQLQHIAANNRDILSKYGQKYGRQIFRVTEVFVDLKAKETNRLNLENNNIWLNRMPKHFMIEKIDIMSVSIGINANDKAVVIINGDIPGMTPIQCNLSTPEFDRKVTSISVREAIEAQRNHDKAIFFSDLSNLTKEVNALNQDTLKDVSNLATYLLGLKQVLSNDGVINNEYLKKYLDECDRESTEIVGTLKVETTTEE